MDENHPGPEVLHTAGAEAYDIASEVAALSAAMATSAVLRIQEDYSSTET